MNPIDAMFESEPWCAAEMPGNQLDGRNTGEKRGTRTFGDRVQSKADELMREIMANRERYLAAWIAETGLHPSECELVEWCSRPGNPTTVIVRKRGPAEDASALRASLASKDLALEELRDELHAERRRNEQTRKRLALLEARQDRVRGALDWRGEP